ncbi:hypothetical protein AA3250_0151 [Gluconobacter albidus NBRC 3250]|nr:hypothetical protein AA3250_0151 [Gluconobacter albidus NBRC 3250]
MVAVPVTRISSGADFETIEWRVGAWGGFAAGRAVICLRLLAGEECTGVLARVVAPSAAGLSDTIVLRAAPHIKKALGPKHLCMGISSMSSGSRRAAGVMCFS